MADMAKMRVRAASLRKQAAIYARLARVPRNAELRERLEDLAKRCTDIANTIERDLASGHYET